MAPPICNPITTTTEEVSPEDKIQWGGFSPLAPLTPRELVDQDGPTEVQKVTKALKVFDPFDLHTYPVPGQNGVPLLATTSYINTVPVHTISVSAVATTHKKQKKGKNPSKDFVAVPMESPENLTDGDPMEEDEKEGLSVMEEDLTDVIVKTYVSGVAAAKVLMPKLKDVNDVYEWVEDLRRFIKLAEKKTSAEDLAAKVILSIEPKDNSSMRDFKEMIRQFRLPVTLIDNVKKDIKDPVSKKIRNRTKAELLEAAIHAAYEGNDRVGREVGTSYAEVERPEMIWEWITAFINGVYLDDSRVNHYKDQLDDLKLVLPPFNEGLPAMNEALNAHITKVKTLLKFSKTTGALAKKRALLRTLKIDHTMARESSRGNTWAAIIQHVRGELDARVSAYQRGYSHPAVQAVEAKVVDKKDYSKDIQIHVDALDAMGMDTSKLVAKGKEKHYAKREDKRDYSRGRTEKVSYKPRPHPYRRDERRDEPRRGRDNSRSFSRRDDFHGKSQNRAKGKLCHWCRLPGHFEENCQAKDGGRSRTYN